MKGHGSVNKGKSWKVLEKFWNVVSDIGPCPSAPICLPFVKSWENEHTVQYIRLMVLICQRSFIVWFSWRIYIYFLIFFWYDIDEINSITVKRDWLRLWPMRLLLLWMWIEGVRLLFRDVFTTDADAIKNQRAQLAFFWVPDVCGICPAGRHDWTIFLLFCYFPVYQNYFSSIVTALFFQSCHSGEGR